MISRLRRSVVGLAASVVLGIAAAVPTSYLDICTTDLDCAQTHGVDIYGNPYPPKEN